MRHEEKSVMLLENQFPLVVTTAVPKGSLLLVNTPASEDISAIIHATHVLEKKFYRQTNSQHGKVESSRKLSVEGVVGNIKSGNRQYLIGITTLASGVEREIILRQTISLDGV